MEHLGSIKPSVVVLRGARARDVTKTTNIFEFKNLLRGAHTPSLLDSKKAPFGRCWCILCINLLYVHLQTHICIKYTFVDKWFHEKLGANA